MPRTSKKQQLQRLGDFTAHMARVKHSGESFVKPTKDGSKYYTPKIKTQGDTSEKSVQDECKSYLARIGAVAHVTTVGLLYTRFGKPYKVGVKGLADIVACLPQGLYAEIECKARSGGTVSYDQIQRLKQIREAGGIYIVVCSAEELAEKLQPYLNDNFFQEEKSGTGM